MKEAVPKNEMITFGAGTHARKVAKACRMHGRNVICFEATKPTQQELDGLPVRSWELADKRGYSRNRQLVCVIINRNYPYQSLINLCIVNAFEDILMPWQYYPILSNEHSWYYWLSASSSLAPTSGGVDQATQNKTLALFSDQESIDKFNCIKKFRRGENLAFSVYASRVPQYFNNITHKAQPRLQPIAYAGTRAFIGNILIKALKRRQTVKACLLETETHSYRLLQDNLPKTKDGYANLSLHCPLLTLGESQAIAPIAAEGESATIKITKTALSTKSNLIRVVRFDDLYLYPPQNNQFYQSLRKRW